MFHHNNLSKVEFTWSMNNSLNKWCVGDDVKSALQKNWVASLACPVIGPNKNDGVVWPSSKTIETTLYAALNMFPTLNITTHEGLELLNNVFLTKSDDESAKLTWNHFLDEHSLSLVDNGNLPIFDISRVAMHATPMTTFLNDQSNQHIHRLIIKKFLLIFNRFQVKGS
uniref:Uncharacterized protein n=1 Tax=Ciona savignyi TaxID=51511 RepID=H2YH45_CIOSA